MRLEMRALRCIALALAWAAMPVTGQLLDDDCKNVPRMQRAISVGISAMGIVDNVLQQEFAMLAQRTLMDEHVNCAKACMSFGFTAFAPELFQCVRSLEAITERSLRDAFIERPVEFTTNSRSGQIFFTTRDTQFMIKGITAAELDQIITTLPDLVHRLNTTNSFVTPIIGAFNIQFDNTDHLFLVTRNLFDKTMPLEDGALFTSVKYDLKGSLYHRLAKPTAAIQLDRDFLSAPESRLRLFNNSRARLLKELRADASALCSYGAIDYSLLIAIYRPRSATTLQNAEVMQRIRNRARHRLVLSDSGDAVYVIGSVPLHVAFPHHIRLIGKCAVLFRFIHTGIIDFLQTYTWAKLVEKVVKGAFIDSAAVSVTDSFTYSERWFQFMSDRLLAA